MQGQKRYSVVEVTESASLEIGKISGCDPQPWHPEDSEESVVEEAIQFHYQPENVRELEIFPHFYGAYRAEWVDGDGEVKEAFFTVRYEEA